MNLQAICRCDWPDEDDAKASLVLWLHRRLLWRKWSGEGGRSAGHPVIFPGPAASVLPRLLGDDAFRPHRGPAVSIAGVGSSLALIGAKGGSPEWCARPSCDTSNLNRAGWCPTRGHGAGDPGLKAQACRQTEHPLRSPDLRSYSLSAAWRCPPALMST